MSLGSLLDGIKTAVVNFFGHSTIGEAILAESKSVAHQAVAVLKTTDIGSTVAADVKIFQTAKNADGTPMTGLQKFDAVVVKTLPLVLKYAAGGGLAGVESDVLGITQELVQGIYNSEVSTTAGAAAVAILKASGVDVPTGAELAAKV